eukprot:Plantae.Rhodophyta-Purpureofilum_apyrenoidigerum.ctg14169.p1 GENE.Plantae.Rhodophyta-Purpureofilum_apyrenoidigerum.ctg14169~~Plantae.Rhodophyta-Purpureofilum_apyrenoidigerum.ctg14169.p1  ORF type:complete len:235 (+),score=55.61 Plantae.Rhodophyta-Purpureofilum_apyrenoidigerum.ctg14169:23-727(+)
MQSEQLAQVMSFSSTTDPGSDCADGDPNGHVTIWVRSQKRKIAGNAAPLQKNLRRYLEQKTDCEVYVGQDLVNGSKPKKRRKNPPKIAIISTDENYHVPIWNNAQKRRISGNAAPLAKNLENYLKIHPECTVYMGQDVMDAAEPTSAADLETVKFASISADSYSQACSEDTAFGSSLAVVADMTDNVDDFCVFEEGDKLLTDLTMPVFETYTEESYQELPTSALETNFFLLDQL